MRRSMVVLSVVVASFAGMAVVSTPGFAYGPKHLYVSPGADNPADNSCTNAGYGTVQSAVNAAKPGTTIIVCAGTYAEQVSIDTSKLTLEASGNAVIEPTSASVNATDENTGQPIVSIVHVEPGSDANLYGLTIDGSQIESSVNGCSDNLIGVLYQASSVGNTAGDAKDLTVEDITPTNNGCGSGQGIFVQSGPSGTAGASVRILDDSISGYGRNGITCEDVGTQCDIKGADISTSATTVTAQNGIQLSFGAFGEITHDNINGDDWEYTTDANPQPQSDFSAGILLYAAGINTSNVQVHSISVAHNTLVDDQIGVEVVDSAATVSKNVIDEVSPGIANSIGVYGVACDAYCGDFNDDQGSSLSSTAQSGQSVTVTHNNINFSAGCPTSSPLPHCVLAAPPGTYGVWLGDDSWTAGSGYSGPAGSELVQVAHNDFKFVETTVEIGGGATT
jgi:hypothetical protein